MRIVVVGNGLVGSAAGRHLAAAGHDVVIVGPDEPVDPARHSGVFASHYDEGRLVSGFSRDPVWDVLCRRSVVAYDQLQDLTGMPIHHRVGRVSASAMSDEERDRLATWLATVDPEGDTVRLHPQGDVGWRAAAPMLSIPDSFDVLVEGGDAGYLNPRLLARAQNVVAERSGARVVRERVAGIDAGADRVVVATDRGTVVVADRVVVAAGAFTNADGLLPTPLPLRCKTETTVWADVSPATAAELAGMPVITYDVADDEIDDVYLAPPIRYPDGIHRIKMGANTAHESWPSDIEEMGAWFRTGDSDADLPALERVLRSMLPTVEFTATTSHRCIVTYTPSRYPTVAAAPDDGSGRIVVATGGNGTGAQCSDALGWLAALVATDRPWPDDVPSEPFRVGHDWGGRPPTASRAQRRAFVHGR